MSRKRGNLTRMGSIPGWGWSARGSGSVEDHRWHRGPSSGMEKRDSCAGRGSAGACPKKDGDSGQSEAVVEESCLYLKKKEGGHACARPWMLIDSDAVPRDTWASGDERSSTLYPWSTALAVGTNKQQNYRRNNTLYALQHRWPLYALHAPLKQETLGPAMLT